MIDVNIEELKVELEKLDGAIEQLRPYSDDFINETKDVLESMNSDFTDNLSKVIGNMRDSKAPKLMIELNNYRESLVTVIDSYEVTDSNLADKVRGD